MPLVTIQVTKEGSNPGAKQVTAEQKAELYKGVSQLLLDVLGKPLVKTWVIFEEVEIENWAQGGLPLSEFRRREALSTASTSS